MRGPLVLSLGLALAPGGLAMAPAPPPAADAAAAASRGVFVDGDSLAVGTRPYLPRALPGWSIRGSVATSRHAAEGPRVLRRAGVLPEVVAVSLGTNDDPRQTARFRSAIRATMRIAGPGRCVVWATIARPPAGGASYAGMNRVLAREARRYANLRLVDWGGVVARHRGWLRSDGVHVTAAGYRARARAFASAIRACS